ncbi:hypothetical protein PYCC9005_004921 [Savitreella phatthalungensis]
MSPGNFQHTAQPPETSPIRRFPGLPKLLVLDRLKRAQVASLAHEPIHLHWVWRGPGSAPSLPLIMSPNSFDTLLLNIPRDTHPMDLYDLRLDQLAAAVPEASFLWIMVRESTPVNLDSARELMRAWGYRRAEDVVWIKSDFCGRASRDSGTFLHDVKEHCLMGIRGTVRRSTDGHIIHCNVDSDVIISEELNESGHHQKPEELYTVIENFCLGKRRLEVFGDRPRRGWITVGRKIRSSNYLPLLYESLWQNPASSLLPFDAQIDALRPKSAGDKPRESLLRPRSHTPTGQLPIRVPTAFGQIRP